MGRRIKVKLQDSTPARVIFLDEKATEGATLGVNLFTPDGLVGTPTTVRAWLGIGPSGETVVVNSGTIHHHLLQGLTEGNDHPQYPLKAGTETISGQWNFTQQVRAAVGSAAAPSYSWETDRDNGMYLAAEDTIGFAAGGAMRATLSETLLYQVVPQQIDNPVGVTDPQQPSTTQYAGLFVLNPDVTYQGGVEITTLTDPLVDPQANGVGSQIAFWEIKNFYGFRIRNDGQVDNDGDLNWYRHANSNDGVLFLKFTRDSNVIQFHPGAAATPIIATFNDLDTGIFWPAANQLGFTTNAILRLTVSTTQILSTLPFRGPDGTDGAPTYSFDGDTNTGMYRGVTANLLGFSTDGTSRLQIGNVDTTGGQGGIRSTLSFRGPAGSATVPAFTFTTDDNTGFYSIGADNIGLSVGGTLRWSVTTAAIIATVPWSGANGSASAPQYAFTNDLDIGMYRVTTDTLGFATAGTERLRFNASGAWGLSGANYGTAGQVLQSNGSANPPTWVDQSGGGGGASQFATYVTVDDETYDLPNSFRIEAGDGIVIDDSVANVLTISSTGVDPTLSYRYFYDFELLTGTALTEGWFRNVTGTAAAITGIAIAGRPGVIQCTSGTGSGAQSGVMRSVDAVTGPTTGIVIGGGEITFRCKMRWVGSTGPGNTTATNCFLRVGLVNEISGAPTDGIYVTSDGETSGGIYANEWLAATRTTAGGITYDQDTAIGITSNLWVEAKIVIDAAGTQADFYIDNVLYASATATMPAGVALMPCFQVQRAAAIGTSFVIQCDYIEVTQVFTTPR